MIMKRKTAGILAGILTGALLFGQVSVQAEEQDAAQTQESELVKSYLTGEDVDASIGRRRPIAVMFGNTSEATPQSGIGNAGVVYEAPVEGEITRLMGILEDYDSLERIGSVRSCRDYYIFYAKEFDAIYTHYGQAAYALPYLEAGYVDNLNGLTLGGTAFYRTTDRQAPHNAYTNYEYLQNGIAALGYSQEYSEDYTGHYLFADEGTETTLENGITANVVKLDNFTYNHPWFTYDSETKEYSRFQYGAEQVDELTGEQLTCDNIILQYSTYRAYDSNGYLNVDVMPDGTGKYITRGKAIDIRWEKDAPLGITHYYDENDQEIRLNTGTTWVEIVQSDRVDSVTYE
jgi:hypothetical protein